MGILKMDYNKGYRVNVHEKLAFQFGKSSFSASFIRPLKKIKNIFG